MGPPHFSSLFLNDMRGKNKMDMYLFDIANSYRSIVVV